MRVVSEVQEVHGLSDSCSFRMLFSSEVHTCSMEARLPQQDCITSSNERLLVSGKVADKNRASTSALSNSAKGSFTVNIMYCRAELEDVVLSITWSLGQRGTPETR
jgi:hypothetical protein